MKEILTHSETDYRTIYMKIKNAMKKKQVIRVNEVLLKRVVAESVKKILSEIIHKETNDETKTFRLKRSNKPGKGMLFYKGDYTYEVIEVVDREIENGSGFYTATWWTVKAKIYGPNPYKQNHD